MSILNNYGTLCEALQIVNEECHDEYGRKAGGFLAQMEKFSTFFGIKLSFLVFSGIEQLSISIQGKDTTVQHATQAAEVAIRYLERQRTDEAFTSFYSQVVSQAKDLTNPPTLPRYRNPPRNLDNGSHSHKFTDPVDYFRIQYFELLDVLINELKRRFQQKRGIPIAALIEKTLIDHSNGTSDNTSNLMSDLDLQ